MKAENQSSALKMCLAPAVQESLNVLVQAVHELTVQVEVMNTQIKHLTNGWTPLHAAAMSGHSTVDHLMKRGAAIEANGGSTSLHYAATNGHTSTVEHLLKRGADINAKNSERLIHPLGPLQKICLPIKTNSYKDLYPQLNNPKLTICLSLILAAVEGNLGESSDSVLLPLGGGWVLKKLNLNFSFSYDPLFLIHTKVCGEFIIGVP